MIRTKNGAGDRITGAVALRMARPERFELPTTKFVAWYSIQLSYGRKQGAEL